MASAEGRLQRAAGAMGGNSPEEASAVTFLQKMLQQAVDLRASDLHFEPY